MMPIPEVGRLWQEATDLRGVRAARRDLVSKEKKKKKKNPKNERTRKGRGGEMEGKREGKKLQRHRKFPLWISVFHYSTEFWLFLRWL